MTVTLNDELVDVPGQQKHYVRVALPDGVDYSTGDHLTVLADNPPAVVDTVLEMLSLDPELRLSVNPRRSSRRLIALDREVSVRELLTHFVELRKPATKSQLRRLAATNPCDPERAALEQLADSDEPCWLSPVELLHRFPACALTGAQLLELLEPMTPRHYSIASSSQLSPREVALIVSVLDTPARSGYGLFKGVASNHLATMPPGRACGRESIRRVRRSAPARTRSAMSSSSARAPASPPSADSWVTGSPPNRPGNPSPRRCASSACSNCDRKM